MREEIRNQDTGNYEVVEHTKTNRDRFVILVPKALKILNKISHESDYIFVRNGQRITARQIAYVLEKYAERQGVSTKWKNPHKYGLFHTLQRARDGTRIQGVSKKPQKSRRKRILSTVAFNLLSQLISQFNFDI